MADRCYAHWLWQPTEQRLVHIHSGHSVSLKGLRTRNDAARCFASYSTPYPPTPKPWEEDNRQLLDGLNAVVREQDKAARSPEGEAAAS